MALGKTTAMRSLGLSTPTSESYDAGFSIFIKKLEKIKANIGYMKVRNSSLYVRA